MGNLFLPFLFLLFLFLVCFIIGIIEPNLVMKWGDSENRTRKNVFKYYGIGLTITLVLFLAFTPLKADRAICIGALLILICFICFICLIIGIRNPKQIIRWEYEWKITREAVFKYYGIVLLFSAFLFLLVANTKIYRLCSFIYFFALVFLLSLICLLIGIIKPKLVINWGKVENITRGKVFKYYGVTLIVSVIMFIPAMNFYESEKSAINAKNTSIQNEQAKKVEEAEKTKKAEEEKKVQELEKQKQEIKSSQEKYKLLLESGKSYESMTNEEGKTADELISNWNKLEQEFKTSYQSQKDSISKSRDEYNAKKKAEQEAKKAAEEKASYNTGITYKQLARTPEDYYGKKVKFTGTVLQVMEGGIETDLRIAINGDHDTVLFATYNTSISSVRILEDDNVTVYGIYTGIQNYQTVLGASRSIPGMSVDKIELNQ